MVQEENPQVKMEEVNHYETVKGGLVIIYKVISSGLLDDFYLVTFDDTQSEDAFGVGPTPEAALESAAREWDRLSDTEKERNDNPFKEVLAQLQK